MPPLPGGEQQHVEHRAVEQPQDVHAKVPPAGQPDRMPDARQADLAGQAMESFFAGPQRVGGNRFLDAEPLALPGVLCRVQYSRGWSLRI